MLERSTRIRNRKPIGSCGLCGEDVFDWIVYYLHLVRKHKVNRHTAEQMAEVYANFQAKLAGEQQPVVTP